MVPFHAPGAHQRVRIEIWCTLDGRRIIGLWAEQGRKTAVEVPMCSTLLQIIPRRLAGHGPVQVNTAILRVALLRQAEPVIKGFIRALPALDPQSKIARPTYAGITRLRGTVSSGLVGGAQLAAGGSGSVGKRAHLAALAMSSTSAIVGISSVTWDALSHCWWSYKSRRAQHAPHLPGDLDPFSLHTFAFTVICSGAWHASLIRFSSVVPVRAQRAICSHLILSAPVIRWAPLTVPLASFRLEGACSTWEAFVFTSQLRHGARWANLAPS
mmetsp:Transcript_20565/g.52254  ORF Transcript_20565/g.52254 Transcript_20565/m.52254 type:complete len:270 (+) Transcript_20565:2206-3015(+)